MHKTYLACGRVCCVVVCSYAVVQIVNVRSDALQVHMRLQRIEASMKQREEADPLLAKECAGGVGAGATKDTPCQAELYRLMQSPQQFHGRWLLVRGNYISGFETSALSPIPPDAPTEPGMLDRHAALWISPVLPGAQSAPG